MNEEEKRLEEIKKAAYEGAYKGACDASGNIIIKTKNPKVGYIISKIILVVILVIFIPIGFSKINPINKLSEQFTQEKPVEDYDLTFENNGAFGYKAADFADVILGQSKKDAKLEVFEQKLSETVELKDAGLLKLKIFTKSKYYTYYGTATYVVDLTGLTNESIKYDDDHYICTLYVPHAILPDKNINVPSEDVKIGDTTKGLLSFGDLNCTDEESQKLMEETKANMKKALKEQNVQKTADDVAKATLFEIYQPLISKAFPGVTLKIEFID